MLRNLLFFILIFLSSPLFAQIPQEGLKAYYTFDGNIASSYNPKYNLSAYGDIAYEKGRSGKNNCAIYTKAYGGIENNAGAYTSDGPTIGAGSHSAISFWFKNDSLEYSIGTIYQDGCNRLSFGQSSKINTNNNTPIIQTSSERFEHFVFNKTVDSIFIYKNAKLLVKEKLRPFACTLSQDVTIARDMGGYLDDMLIYSRSLTEKEIQQLYEEVSSCEITGYWEEKENNSLAAIIPVNGVEHMYNLVSSQSLDEIEIFDGKGMKVEVKFNSLNSFTLKNPGLYYVKISSTNVNQTIKLVVE